LVDPVCRCLFQLAQEIRQAVRGLEADQQMHVIGNATDAFGTP
jgi:hypothetical protein